MAAAGEPHHSASLYVGDLAPEVNEATLFEYFNVIGPVASIRVCRDAVTRRSLGYAYVNFHHATDAERTLDSMNYTQILNRPCRIMWSQRDPSLRKSGVGNIFVKNLDRSIDHKTLYDTFSVFGNILSCKVSTSLDGQSLGYGFVHFETDESARKAIENANGMEIAGLKVYVAPFKPKNERESLDSATFTNVYVKNLPEDFTPADLQKLFEPFGEITSSTLAVTPEKKFRGFGFVNFLKPESASAAVEKLNDSEFGGKVLYVGRAMKRNERAKLLREKFEKQRAEREKKWQGCNLYVKNLPDKFTDENLRTEFEKFGTITSVRIMIDGNGNSRGFGFVCFSNPEEASRALSEMHNKIIDMKPLYVSQAQRKEFRRAQLEAYYAGRNNIKQVMFQQGPPGPQPMYYQQPMVQPPRQPGYMYPGPQNMVPRRGGGGPWRQQPGPQVVNRAQAPMYVSGGGKGAAGGRGGRDGGSRGGRGGAYPAKYPVEGGGGFPPQPAVPAISQLPPLTSQALAAAGPEEQKQMIGERLFPLIREMENRRAGKITGMLLEMDNSDLLELLESRDHLFAKVQEAVRVLEAHENQEQQDKAT